MVLNSLKVFKLAFVITLVNAIHLNHDISDTKPIIYKILERNNKIIIQRENRGVNGINIDYLKRFLKQNADLEYNINNIIKASRPANGQKRRLVRKIVPHGVDTSDDSRLYNKVGTVFKPLLKVHKTKKLESSPGGDSSVNEDTVISFQNAMEIPKLEQVQSQLERLMKYRSKIQDRKNVDHDLEPKLVSETKHTMQHLSEIERLANVVQNPMLKMVMRSKMSELREQTERTHSSIIKLISVAGQPYSDSLRYGTNHESEAEATKPEESSEESPVTEQPFINIAPGISVTFPPDKPPTELQCALFPHQPAWNFWKYSHSIINEQCPDGTLIGNVCSRIPPHK